MARGRGGGSSSSSIINFPSGGGTSIVTIILGIIAIIVIIYFVKKNPDFFKNLFGGGNVGAVAAGDFADANPPMMCNNVTEGGLEQDGDRKEPQIACGFNFLNTEAIVYVNVHGINDTLSIKLRGPKLASLLCISTNKLNHFIIYSRLQLILVLQPPYLSFYPVYLRLQSFDYGFMQLFAIIFINMSQEVTNSNASLITCMYNKRS